jgi:predicted nucleotidyltransferase
MQFVDELEKKITVEKVILFGSYARNAPHDFSDIDILVVSPDFHGGTMKDCALLDRIARKINPLIEAIPYSSNDFENFEKGDFIHEIRLTGKIIFDRVA